MVSTETLAKTARLRAILAFLLVLTSTFMIASMSTRGGWALGQITTIWTLPTTTTTSCPDKVPTGSTCQVVSTVTEVIVAELNYGLFGDIKYVTDTNSVTSWTLSVDGGPAVKQDPLASHGLEDVNLQPDYKIWAKGNPPYINNVRATQAFALWAFFSTVVAGVILLAALHMSPSKRLAEWRIKVGFYWLLLSWFSLFLTFVIWVGTPVSAFTNACEACDNPALCAKDFACVQLNGGLCPPSEKEKGACEVNADVTKAGGMWGLIFFSFLLQFFAMVVWRKLYADVVRSSYEDNRPNMGVMPSDGPGEPTATDYNNL